MRHAVAPAPGALHRGRRAPFRPVRAFIHRARDRSNAVRAPLPSDRRELIYESEVKMRRVVVSQGSRDILYGETPYGWRLSRDRSKLVIDGDEQRVLAVVRHMYFVERIPMRSVV